MKREILKDLYYSAFRVWTEKTHSGELVYVVDSRKSKWHDAEYWIIQGIGIPADSHEDYATWARSQWPDDLPFNPTLFNEIVEQDVNNGVNKP